MFGSEVLDAGKINHAYLSRMDWFCALTEDDHLFRHYSEMVTVAVYTARKLTSLRPHLIYDGSDNEFTDWLDRHGVRIIRHRSLFRAQLASWANVRKILTSRRRFRSVPASGTSATRYQRFGFVYGLRCDFQRRSRARFAQASLQADAWDQGAYVAFIAIITGTGGRCRIGAP